MSGAAVGFGAIDGKPVTKPFTVNMRTGTSIAGSERSRILSGLTRHKPQDANAEMMYRWALELDGSNFEAMNGLACILAERGGHDALSEALLWFDAIQPKNPHALVNEAIIATKLGYHGSAIKTCQSAISLYPDFPDAYVQLQWIYDELGDREQAATWYQRGLAACPDSHPLHFAYAEHLLRAGDFERGWQEYEHRGTRLHLCERLDEYPEWNGECLRGKEILVCCEQGLGDNIMFSRYLNLIWKTEGNPTIFCKPDLARWMEAEYPGIEIVTTDRELADLSPDYWIGIASLPLKLGIMEPLPCWKAARQPKVATGPLRVGLCWKGNPQHRRDALRSLSFDSLKPLLEVGGCEFYSLQQGEAAGLRPFDGGHDLQDLSEAMQDGLDIVITVDTMIAHLAGAAGIPTWLILPHAKYSDWRWRESDKTTTPWYPSMRIFRQGDAVAECAAELTKLTCNISTRGGEAASRMAHNHQTVGSNPTPATILTANTRYGPMQYHSRDKWLGRSLQLYSEWSHGEVELFKRVLKPGDDVIEVGANIGAHTLALAEIVGPNGRVTAFEPERSNYQLLKTNAGDKADPGTIPHPVIYPIKLAIGSEPYEGAGGPVVQVPEHFEENNPGGTEFARGFSIDSIMPVTLALGLCHFLKIDVEGMEHDVLLGAESLIANSRPVIYAENDRPGSTEALASWALDHDYRVYQHMIPLYNPDNVAGYRVNVFGSIVSAMMLMIPRERKDLRPQEWGLGIERLVVERG